MFFLFKLNSYYYKKLFFLMHRVHFLSNTCCWTWFEKSYSMASIFKEHIFIEIYLILQTQIIYILRISWKKNDFIYWYGKIAWHGNRVKFKEIFIWFHSMYVAFAKVVSIWTCGTPNSFYWGHKYRSCMLIVQTKKSL